MCPRNHSYDLSRSGYVNLLQPQDRRSTTPGDSKAAVEARLRLLASGIGATILDAIARRAPELAPSGGVVADLGCGAGNALASIAASHPVCGIGIDLSSAAIDLAARRFPGLTWVVANADRRLPILDEEVGLVLSVHGRRNPTDCARVLGADGLVLMAIPAPDDLIELRRLVMGLGIERDRSETVIAEHDPRFVLLDRSIVRERHLLDSARLLDLLRGTYRGGRAGMAERLDRIHSLEVTLASELFVFRRR